MSAILKDLLDLGESLSGDSPMNPNRPIPGAVLTPGKPIPELLMGLRETQAGRHAERTRKVGRRVADGHDGIQSGHLGCEAIQVFEAIYFRINDNIRFIRDWERLYFSAHIPIL